VKIVISAGEVSGDQRGAEMVRALKKIAPDIEVRGMGGAELEAAGVVLDVDLRKSANVSGTIEILRSLAGIIKSFNRMKRLLKQLKPDALVVVDYPDFNMRLAAAAEALSIPVMYLIPPKLWAWREGRIEKIKKYVAKIASIFPFEPEFYQKHGYKNCLFIGHPLVDQINSFKREQKTKNNIVCAVFPGSRKSEISYHLKILAEAMAILEKQNPKIEFVVSLPRNIAGIEDHLRSLQRTQVVVGDSLNVLAKSDVAILKSGTCNLEAALLGLPFVVVYKMSAISYYVADKMTLVREASPVNILRSKTAVELLQTDMTAENIVKELQKILPGNTLRETMKENLQKVSEMLQYPEKSSKTSADRSAELLIQLINTAK
jgi:lipid-A-disaccharide synthase